MSKLVSCIYRWYVVFLLVMGYMSQLVSAEVKGVVVTKSGGAVNPYLGTLQVSAYAYVVLPFERKDSWLCTSRLN